MSCETTNELVGRTQLRELFQGLAVHISELAEVRDHITELLEGATKATRYGVLSLDGKSNDGVG